MGSMVGNPPPSAPQGKPGGPPQQARGKPGGPPQSQPHPGWNAFKNNVQQRAQGGLPLMQQSMQYFNQGYNVPGAGGSYGGGMGGSMPVSHMGMFGSGSGGGGKPGRPPQMQPPAPPVDASQAALQAMYKQPGSGLVGQLNPDDLRALQEASKVSLGAAAPPDPSGNYYRAYGRGGY